MYLTSLTLKDFAGLAAADLQGFEPGLNVVVGDNEAGKSTLLLALRAAFFQRHRATGESAKALGPYGKQVRPEIDVGFELRGTHYSLRKGFLQKPEARLAWAGGEMSGDAVEERLAELLGFAHPGRGESKLGEHQGAFGLLWVEQGRSHEHDLDLGVGRNAVTASLEGEIGQILGGDRGRALIAAAKALHDRYFTTTGRVVANSPLRQVEETLQARRAELGERETARRDYDEKLDRLRARRETLLSYMSEDAVGAAERAVEAADETAKAVAAREREHAEACRELDHALARRAAAFDTLARREALAARLAEAERARDGTAAALDDVRRSGAGDRAEGERLEAERDAARATVSAARQSADIVAARAERARLTEEIARLERRLAETAGIDAALSALSTADAGPRLDRKALAVLEAAGQARREAEIRMTATAPAILFEPSGKGTVRDAGDNVLPAGTPLPVLVRTSFGIEGFGRVIVEPGVDLRELRRAFEEASATFAGLLDRHRVDGLDAARRVVAAAEERAAETKRLKSRREAIVPEGMAGTLAALDSARISLRTLGGDVVPARGGEAADGPPADPAAARAALGAAEARLAAADVAFDGARKALSAFAARLARAEAEAEHSAGVSAGLRSDMAAAEAARTFEALRSDLASAELDRSAKAAIAEMRKRALEEADPETAARTLQARRRALDEIRRVEAGLRAEIAGLEGELRAEGLTSLGEDIARLVDEIEVLDGRRRRLSLEAEASRLLHASLLSAQSEAREHWLGPIKAEVAPYLRLIHPESEVAFDDSTLAITGLSRRGVEEEFKRLSAGAREQVAVVTRLALASVLKRGGHPALVILDDALVNTDERRLARMHLVLQKAAEAMQIVVLTCRERDFRDLGGKIFRL